ncbi:alcohol dehydrogenase catalytic domain-containing protein [Nocardia pseudobrasiliensis]|uniref:Alcohol dehydrogenase n=1 Tax=Nocardia pseudobrasiliensis TaxID=45979 RepID=A0A370IC84_9NOCA|nr:alcohol dehydrogenase catalytic domain-containing protein [Nocardia pseudobrasiliensis]RDI68352.1 alcohol dehydrogenase [Nocardia pseudobrasiliensis]
MRELNLLAPGTLRWLDRPEPKLLRDDDAIVRPFVASRCDSEWTAASSLLRVLRFCSRARLLDPVFRDAFGAPAFAGPCAVGHECVAEVVEVGPAVAAVGVGDKVVVPFTVSCGDCDYCRRGLTAKCVTARRDSGQERPLAWYGHGSPTGPYGGMVSDFFRVPYANHMLARLPHGLEPLRVAAASDNLTDGFRCVVPHLRHRPNARVLVVGGLARSVGLYAAGIAAACGAQVDYLDSSPERLAVAEALGAHPKERPGLLRFPRPSESYEVVVDASNVPAGVPFSIRSTAPGGICEVPSYHMAAYTAVPLMHMTLTDITLHVGLSHPGAILPEVLAWVHDNDFAAEKVAPEVSDFDDAPKAYGTKRVTKPVLYRAPLTRSLPTAAKY